jgi:RNA polymerase sigma-70 factor, ECF subfamily
MSKTSTTTLTVARIESTLNMHDPEIAAAANDSAARWRSLEACRDYLRLVARRDSWSRRPDEPDTSDLVQNTILEGWRAFARFEGRSRGQLRAWLKAMLVHASINSRRRREVLHHQEPAAAEIIAGTTTSPSQAAQRSASVEVLDAALALLSQRHRAVIHLRIWDQMPFAQIGTSLGISEDAARMLYGRALATLRETMRPGHDPG